MRYKKIFILGLIAFGISCVIDYSTKNNVANGLTVSEEQRESKEAQELSQ